jgi:hypothetical protein
MYGSLSGGLLDIDLYEDSEGMQHLQLKLTSQAHNVTISRTFTRKPDGSLEVVHDAFKLPVDKRGAGIAKKVLRDSMNEYERLGVKKVTLHANLNVGGYAWAKFGFKATDPQMLADDLRNFITNNLESGQDAPDEDWGGERRRRFTSRAQEAREALQEELMDFVAQHESDPKLPWLIAGLSMPATLNVVGKQYTGKEIGKKLLIEQSWDAELDLSDKEAMARFRSYVGT